MKAMSIQKIARVLHALVLIALICNLVILYLVPVAVVSMEASGSHGLLAGVAEYLGDIFHPGEDDIVAAGAAASFLAWFWFWQDTASLSLTLFLAGLRLLYGGDPLAGPPRYCAPFSGANRSPWKTPSA